jgi:hypothetical protein
VLDRRAATDEPDDGFAEQGGAAADDLAVRLRRLGDSHPSAHEYRASDHDRVRYDDQAPGSADSQSEPVQTDSPEQNADEHPETDDAEPGQQAASDRRETDDAEPGPQTTDERRESGHESAWDAPDVRDIPGRPDVDAIHLSADRARHILDGDGAGKPPDGPDRSGGGPDKPGGGPDKPGGGHRHGTGLPDKTEFPEGWTDEVILSAVEEIARQPDAVERQSNGRWRVTGERDSVRVWAVVDTDGRIRTAWPEPGSPGVRHNPKDGGA